MIDASHYGYEENIRVTKEVVDYAHKMQENMSVSKRN